MSDSFSTKVISALADPKPYFLDAMNEIDFVTAAIVTSSGHRVTVIARRNFAMVIWADGLVSRGTHFHVVGRSLFLRDNDKDTTIVRMTPIQIDVFEN